MLGSRMANLSPLARLIFENRARHIHLCSSTGSVLKASPNYTSQSPEEGSEVTIQQAYLPLQVSWGCSWKSTDKVWTASELDPIRIISSGAQGTPFTACSLTWSLLAHTTFLLVCGLWGNCFYLHVIGLPPVIPHWTADAVSYEDLLRTWRLFLQSGFFCLRSKHSSQAPGA